MINKLLKSFFKMETKMPVIQEPINTSENMTKMSYIMQRARVLSDMASELSVLSDLSVKWLKELRESKFINFQPDESSINESMEKVQKLIDKFKCTN